MYRDDRNDARPDTLADRLPPFNLEAEEGVLGSVLVDPAAFDEVSGVLKPGDFYRDSHAAVWREMLAVDGDGFPVDPVILNDRLARSKPRGLDGVDLLGLLADLANGVPHAANAKYYADIVKQKAVSRSLIETANAMLRDGYSNDFTAEQLLDSAGRRLLAVADGTAGGETVRADAVIPDVLADIDARRGGQVSGLSSGLTDLDDMTCGFLPGSLVYLAARTSVGKSCLAANIIDHLSVRQGRPSLLVTLEMSRKEFIERLIVIRSGVDGQKVRTGRVTDPERARIGFAAEQVVPAPIFIDDTPGRNATQIAANTRRYKAREGIQIVVVDLINLVSGETEKQDRREQMAFISRRLKLLARELEIPVLVLAQINRKPEEREGKRPRKSDIKDCGNIEEDADQVLILHRPDYYDPNDHPGEAWVIVDKNRSGPTGDVKLRFHKETMRFDNYVFVPDAANQGPDF